MTIELTAGSHQFIDRQIALGNFTSPQEVVEAALEALERRQARLTELRSMIQPAIDAIDRGEHTPFSAEEIKRLGREQLSRSQAGTT